jgi:hypothetical protein
MGTDYRHLNVDRLIETADRIASRIEKRFPEAALGKIARDVVAVTRSAVATAEKINRPNWWLRGGLIALAVLVLAGAVVVALALPGQDPVLVRVADFLVKAQGAVIFLTAIVVFFWTLETRFKRRKAVKAIHELRVLAHVIDMHQLSKDPDYSGQEGRSSYSPDELWHYMRFCTELLAILSKIGHLYVEDFHDSTTLMAGDQLERLATGLSQKIWQKLILERIRREEKAMRPADVSDISGAAVSP